MFQGLNEGSQHIECVYVEFLITSLFSSNVTNTRDNKLIKKKGLFWLLVLEVLVHNWSVPLLWVCGGTSWCECIVVEQNRSLHGQEVKER
jgi:hypothetical protein